MTRFFLLTVLVIAAFVWAWSAIEKTGVPSAALASGAALATGSSYAYANASSDDIFVSSPKPGDEVTTTILVEGYARGSWYSEAVFPVTVMNAAGTVIGTGQGKANGDWMTSSFVPFTAEVDLRALYNGRARIVLKKDNPSGIAANDASLSFPVMIR